MSRGSRTNVRFFVRDHLFDKGFTLDYTEKHSCFFAGHLDHKKMEVSDAYRAHLVWSRFILS
jgi:hypothetical protein